MTVTMIDHDSPDHHLDEDQIDEAASPLVDDLNHSADELQCAECEAQVRMPARVLQLARLLALDPRVRRHACHRCGANNTAQELPPPGPA